MIYIIARMSSKCGEIRPWTTELAALECLKKSHRLIMEKMTSSHGNDDIHESLDEFEIWPDQTTGFYGNR